VSDKVPDSIVLAAMAVADWFNSQSLSPNLGWEFMNICSRNHADRLKELERELNAANKRISKLNDYVSELETAGDEMAKELSYGFDVDMWHKAKEAKP
jgi:hypothetical protein